ncbi:MAG TPA: hypothetical protein VGD98_23100 [Ktedonobacteraceae bacterium]
MRGKLRDKYDTKRERLKRETMMGRRPIKRDNRNLHLQPFDNDDANEFELEEEGGLTISEEQQN